MTNSQSYFSLNGQALSQNAPLDLFSDRGLAYGHGLFETILLHNSQLPLVNRHLARLCSGASVLNICVEYELVAEYLRLFINQLNAQSINNGIVKVIVTAGQGGRGYESPKTSQANIICGYFNLPEDLNQCRNHPIDVRCCEHRLPESQPLAGIKHLNRLDQVLARSEWRDDNYQEGLMFTQSNYLIEAVSANVFVKTKSGTWVTPSVERAGIAGVMRSLMVEEVFPACNIPIEISDITMDELSQCQSLLLCNSIKGLSRVQSVDNQTSQWRIALPRDQQALMLCKTLTEMYPQYQ